jgi:hypothetical protein
MQERVTLSVAEAELMALIAYVQENDSCQVADQINGI